jgi:hypothetical protein
MAEEKKETGVPAALQGIVDIVYLNRDNCKITEKNGFIGLRAIIDKPKDVLLTDEKEEKPEEPANPDIPEGKMEKIAERIFLSRAFPFDMPFDYISVLDKDKKEIGFIRSLDDFDDPDKTLLIHELETKYYTPVIKKILAIKERYGFSYWKCECEFGEKSFTLQDTFRSIIKATNASGTERVYILDVDGNRYEIPDVEALDRHSYKKIELYL